VETPPLATKATPPARPVQPLVSRPAARKGGGAILILGLGLAAVLVLAVIAGGAWYLFGRQGREPQRTASVESTLAPATTEPVSPATSTPPETTAPAEAPGPAGSATPGQQPTAPATSRAASGSSPARTTTPAAPIPPPPGPGAPAAGGAGGGDYAYLDDVPAETADGRAAGEALAQKYRSGSSGASGGYPATRFPRRQRVPPGVTVPERPAVATLLYVHSAQEAFHRKSGRYGNLRELADANLFVLDVPFDAEAFRRARYGFRVTAEADGYRAEAAPQGPVGRAFIVDDTGFVRLRDD
jgi:hypothetical protein